MSSRRRLDVLGSLTGRLVLIVGGVVVATSAALFAFLQVYQGQVIEANLTRLFLAEVEGARVLIETAKPDERRAVLDRFAERGFEVRSALPDGVGEGKPAPLWARANDRRLREQARDDVRFAWEVSAEPRVWAGLRIEGRDYWLPFYLSASRDGERRPLFVWLLLLAGITLLTSWLIVILLNRPLQRFARGLEAALPKLAPVEIAGSAPPEIRAVAERVNELTADLRQRQAERELMLAGVSHDLRTPLTRMRLRVDVLDDCDPDDVTALRRDLDAMRAIVDRFVEVVRTGREAVGATSDAVARIAGLIAAEAALGRAVAGDLSPAVLPIAPEALDRLVANLLDNARRYGKPPVRVRLAHVDAGIELAVIDAGAGIASAERARATEPFRRLETARPFSGASGLGLFVVRRLAEQTGATLGFRDEADGFAVTVTWPQSSGSVIS